MVKYMNTAYMKYPIFIINAHVFTQNAFGVLRKGHDAATPKVGRFILVYHHHHHHQDEEAPQ